MNLCRAHQRQPQQNCSGVTCSSVKTKSMVPALAGANICFAIGQVSATSIPSNVASLLRMKKMCFSFTHLKSA